MAEFTYRRGTAADRAKILDFINLVFSVAHRPHDFRALLPKVYGDGRGQDDIHRLALDEAGCVRGAVAMLPGALQVGEATLRTGYVGSVSTHPYARGEGHMKRLMRMVLADAAAEGIDLLLLGGLRQRYGYFGFTPGGLRQVFTVGPENVRHALGGVDASAIAFQPMREALAEHVDAAYALYAAQPVRVQRTRADFTVTLESWTRSPFVILKDGCFAGYLTATENGDTLGELLLVDMAELPAVVKAWMVERKHEALCVPAALYDFPMSRALGAFAEDWEAQVCQKLRVLNFPRVLGALMPLSAALRPLADGSISMWIDGRPLTIAVAGGAVSISEQAPEGAPRLTAMEAQALFFSPFSEADRRALPAGWFPIPLCLPEADCF